MDYRSAFAPVVNSKVDNTQIQTGDELPPLEVVRRCWECCSEDAIQSVENDVAKAKELIALLSKYPSLPINSLRDANQHTLLIRTCTKRGNAAAAQALLSRSLEESGVRVDWNICDPHGNSPLHHAIINHNSFIVQLLLDTISAYSAGSKQVVSFIQLPNNLGCSGLHLAAEHGDLDILKLLFTFAETVQISSGERIQALDVNSQDVDGFTPLHYACMYSHPLLIHHLVAVESANPLVFNCAGELPSDLTKNALTKKFLMAATQFRLSKSEGVTVDKKIKIEHAFKDAASALLESVGYRTLSPLPGSPSNRNNNMKPFAPDNQWNATTLTAPTSPKRPSPIKTNHPVTPPATTKFHNASFSTPNKQLLFPLSPQRTKALDDIDPVKDTPALFEATFKAMTEEAREIIQQRTLNESFTSQPDKSPMNRSLLKVSPVKLSSLSPHNKGTNGAAEPRQLLSSERAFTESIAKFQRHGADNVTIVASKTAPIDTGLTKKVEKLVIDFDSDDEIVFKPFDKRPTPATTAILVNTTTSSGRSSGGYELIRRPVNPSTPAVSRQLQVSLAMSQPRHKVEKNPTTTMTSNTKFKALNRSVSTPVRARRPKSSVSNSNLTQSGGSGAVVPPKAIEKIKQTVTPRRSASTGSFGMKRSKSFGVFESNPLLASASKRPNNNNSNNTTNLSSSGHPPLSPTRAYLSSLTPSKSYMAPTTSTAVSAGIVMEKRNNNNNNTVFNFNTAMSNVLVVPRSQNNKYHQVMPNADEVLNTEKVELQVFLGTLNRILDLHANGVKKLFYRWKHFKVPDISARKKLSNSFNAVASPGQLEEYDDSHVVKAGGVTSSEWKQQQFMHNDVVDKVKHSSLIAQHHHHHQTTTTTTAANKMKSLHVNVSPAATASLHQQLTSQLDQFSPVSMSDLSCSTAQDMQIVQNMKRNGLRQSNNNLLGVSKLNSPYATLKSTARRSSSPTKVRSSALVTRTEVKDSFDYDVYCRIEPMIRSNEFALEKMYFHFSSHNKANRMSSVPMFDRCLMSESDLWYLLMCFGVCPQICSKVQLSHSVNVILTTHVPLSQANSLKGSTGTGHKVNPAAAAVQDLSMETGSISFIHFVKILWQISYLCNTSLVQNPPPTVQFAYLLQIMDSSGGRQKIAKLSRTAQMIPPFVYLHILNEVY